MLEEFLEGYFDGFPGELSTRLYPVSGLASVWRVLGFRTWIPGLGFSV